MNWQAERDADRARHAAWAATEEGQRQIAENRAVLAAEEEWEERLQKASEAFFDSLRKNAPDLFAGRSISLPAIKRHEQAIKEAARSIEERPGILRCVDWPVSISKAAHREFDLWIVRMNREVNQ